MYKLFLCLRYLLHRRIVIVPIVAVMLCVAMNLIVVSLMSGFLEKIRSSVRGLFGDVIIGNGSLGGFGYYDAYTDAEGKEHPGLLQYLGKVQAVKAATPVIENVAGLRLPEHNNYTTYVRVLGIEPAGYSAVTDFQNGLYWEKPGPDGGVSLEPDGAAARQAQAAAARKRGDVDLAEQIEARLADDREELVELARIRAMMNWQGPPNFVRVPDVANPTSQPTELANLVANVANPAGIIVGIRVFWSSPDVEGKYKRQYLVPGRSTVQLTLWPASVRGVAAEKPEVQQFYFVDTSHSHIPQIDSAFAFVPFDRLQQSLRMAASEGAVNGFRAPARTTRVLVKFADGVPLEDGRKMVQVAVNQWMADRMEAFRQMPDPVRARAINYEPFAADGRPNVTVEIWKEANKDYYAAIENQRFIALLMVGVVSLTVVGLIWVIFIMIVVEKTKDIGIIKSVGGSAGGVATIFICWAAVIGAIGAALGGVLGGQFIRHVNGIEKWLSKVVSWVTGEETHLFDPRAYLFESIPARFAWNEFWWVAGAAVVAAMLGALLPAWRAGRMNPVETLRYE